MVNGRLVSALAPLVLASELVRKNKRIVIPIVTAEDNYRVMEFDGGYIHRYNGHNNYSSNDTPIDEKDVLALEFRFQGQYGDETKTMRYDEFMALAMPSK